LHIQSSGADHADFLELNALPFPEIDPVALQLGPLALRWYGLAYFAGFILGILLIQQMIATCKDYPFTFEKISEVFTYAVVGVVLGGRIGSIVFYNLDFYLENPVQMLRVWEGGMSFHGGLIGVVFAVVLFCRLNALPLMTVADLVATAAPIGLFLGRIANFVNGELWGRVTTVPWAVVFPSPEAGSLPRHPSQLYEAAGEGLFLLVVLLSMAASRKLRLSRGLAAGTFLSGYAVIRFLVEFTREPDASYIWIFTRGQALSVPMAVAGLVLIFIAVKRGSASKSAHASQA
jgi:phosphatidylglycerol:prolipoprotein diacylglycerol transferase